MSKLFVSKRTRAAAWVILLVLPALMVAFGYYHSHRPAVNPVGSRTFWDYIILNSDILLGLLFLLASAIPFILVFDKKKPQARELVPIAVMAAIAVVGRTVFEIIPLPNFKPCSAIIIITAVAFGPEAGFMVGAVSALASNFFYGQGAYTPWQMFAYGAGGMLAGFLFAKNRLPKKPVVMGVFGFLAVLLFVGPLLDTCTVFLTLPVINAQTAWPLYVSGFPVNLSQGLCTLLTMLLFGKPLLEKLDRVKLQYGMGEDDGV